MATSVLPQRVGQTACPRSTSLAVKLERFAFCAVLGIYLLAVSSQWFMTGDTALYLMLGENLAAGEGYTLWGVPHAHVPPGYPLFLAAMMELGLNEMLWLNLSSILMGLTIIWLVYKYAAMQTSHTMSVLIAVSLAFSQSMHMASFLVQSDIFFMLMVWVGLYCYLRGLNHPGYWLEAGTAALVAACWIRLAGFPLAAGAAVGLVLQARTVSRRRVWLNAISLVITILLTAGIFYLYHKQVTAQHAVQQTYSGYVGIMAKRTSWEWMYNPALNFLETGRGVLRVFTGQQHRALGTLVVGLIWIPLLVGMATAFKRRQFLGLCSFVAYLGVLSVNEGLMARYVLPVAPLAIWYFIEGVRWLVERRPAWRPAGPQVALWCALVLLACNIPHTLSYAYYVHYPESYRLYTEWQDTREVAQFLKREARAGERFVSSQFQRDLAYLTGIWPARISSRRFDSGPPSLRDYETWIKDGMTFLVKWKTVPKQCSQTIEELCQLHGFRLVLANEFCEVYSSRPVKNSSQVAALH